MGAGDFMSSLSIQSASVGSSPKRPTEPPLLSWDAILAKVPEASHGEFRRLVTTGTASESFLQEIDTNPELEEASDLALELMLGRLAKLAEESVPQGP